jgi:tetratricopeptide (TPR) repeat protein
LRNGFLSAALASAAMPAAATVDDRAILSAYAKARAADGIGAAAIAAESYAAGLALTPDNEILAARAVSQALAAGDRALAVRAARILEQKGLLAPDTRLLLLSEALLTRDWKSARTHIEAIQQDKVFAFMTPVLRAWVAHDTRKGDPLAMVAEAQKDQLAAGYSAEHRPLLLIARGKKEGVAELLKVSESAGLRGSRLRVAGAATLARKGDRNGAAALLAGETEPLVAARKLLESGKTIPGEVTTARAGIAEFLIRIATDLSSQNVDALALSYARLATFLAPENSETWLVTSELLGAAGQQREALAALANVRADDPFADSVKDGRIKLLVGAGDKPAALAEAEAASRTGSASVADWARLGDLYTEVERLEEAAAAYAQAIELARKDGKGSPEWTLWLLRGGALERAGKWPEAKAALERAYKLAPEQPLVLNYLGYAQLQRRENVEEAMKLIAQASKLQPESAEITDSLGWAHYLRGNLRDAINLLERAVAGQPADAEINEHLGDAYYSAGRRYEARYAWQAALLHAEEEDAARIRAKIDSGLTAKLASP